MRMKRIARHTNQRNHLVLEGRPHRCTVAAAFKYVN